MTSSEIFPWFNHWLDIQKFRSSEFLKLHEDTYQNLQIILHFYLPCLFFFSMFLKKWFSFQDAIWQNKLKEVQEKLNSLQHPLIKKELDEVLPELVKRKLVVLEEVPRMMVCLFYSVNFKHKDETLILSSNTVPCEIKLDFPIKYCLVIFHVLKKSSKELFTVCFAGVGNNVISYSGRLCWVHKKYLIHTSNVNIVEVRHNQSMAVH